MRPTAAWATSDPLVHLSFEGDLTNTSDPDLSGTTGEPGFFDDGVAGRSLDLTGAAVNRYPGRPRRGGGPQRGRRSLRRGLGEDGTRGTGSSAAWTALAAGAAPGRDQGPPRRDRHLPTDGRVAPGWLPGSDEEFSTRGVPIDAAGTRVVVVDTAKDESLEPFAGDRTSQSTGHRSRT
ncbi:MAG TPA: hypothetical protein EYO90_01590 [Candidatus Latescibacteria bacterium]|nr:hypothetical protein [Candidatus Latescibacterota bacterium]